MSNETTDKKLLNIIRESRSCIDKYLERFKIKLETCEQNFYGQIKGKIKLLDVDKKDSENLNMIIIKMNCLLIKFMSQKIKEKFLLKF